MTGDTSRTAYHGRPVRVLVTAASRYGATAAIADAIGEGLARRGLTAVVLSPEEVESVAEYDAVVLGSAVYRGQWLEPAMDLVRRSGAALADRPVWLFSSGPVGDPARKLARPLRRDPAGIPALIAATCARGHRLFPGKLDRRSLGLRQRLGLLFAPGLEGDFRDWAAVREWAGEIASQLTASGALRATG